MIGEMRTKFVVSFKNSDAIHLALARLHDDNRDPYRELADSYFDSFTTKIDKLVDAYSKYESEIRIEFDILNGTARLLPLKEWE